jgi:hypothetical protein
MLFATPLDRVAEAVERGALLAVGIGPTRRLRRGVAEREPGCLHIARRILEQEADREVTEDVPGQDEPGLLADERRESVAERGGRASLP